MYYQTQYFSFYRKSQCFLCLGFGARHKNWGISKLKEGRTNTARLARSVQYFFDQYSLKTRLELKPVEL